MAGFIQSSFDRLAIKLLIRSDFNETENLYLDTGPTLGSKYNSAPRKKIS